MESSVNSRPAPTPALGSRLRVGIIWNFAATIAIQGSTFAANIIVAQMLGRHAFGEYAAVQITLMSLSVLVHFSLGYTAGKYVAEFRSVDPGKVGRILALCSTITTLTAWIGTIVLLSAAEALAKHMLEAEHIEIPLRIGAGFLFFNALNLYQTGVLGGLESYQGLAKAGVLSAFPTVIGSALGGYYYGVNGAVLGLSASAFLRWMFHNWWLRRELSNQGLVLNYREMFQERRIFTHFALPAVLASYVNLPIAWLANASLIRQPNGFSEMALYSAGTNFRVLVLFVPLVINSVGLTILNGIKGQRDARRYKEMTMANTRMIFGSALVFAAGLALCGEPVLRLFGKDFVTGYSVLLVLLLSTVPESLFTAFYQGIQVHGNMWLSLFGIVIPWQATFAAFAYFLIPTHGALGMATAYLLASVVQMVLTGFHGRRLRRKKERSAESVLTALEIS